MTQFKEGDQVRALETVQGMVKGRTYTVFALEQKRTPFGTFVTYWVRGSNNTQIPVINGHLLLEEAHS